MSLTEPLRFEAQTFERVWGGRALDEFLPDGLGVDGPVGEVWELVDRDDMSSVVAAGPLAGRTLRGLMLSERESILGATRPAAGGHFPIIVKFLDASQQLSVQVHPDEQTAAGIGVGAAPKTECWYVLSAEPGADVYVGLRPGVDASSFAACASSSAVLDSLQSFEVRAGDFVYVPAGTVHAIGAGISVVEIQQNSDTTYRLFDWDRPGLDGEPRELHPDEALRSVEWDAEAKGPLTPELVGDVNRSAPLVDDESFAVDLLAINEPLEQETDGRALVYVVLQGKGQLTVPGVEECWDIRRGETWLVPAAAERVRFQACDGDLSVLRVETKS